MIYDVNLVDANENSPWWYVCENISRNQKVLDVGCATGYLGEILKNNFDVDVVGVDNQDFHLDKAKKLNVYSDLIKLDLNSFGSELDEYTYYFDRIILCDVLEHLIDPMDVLRKLSRFLKVDGKFLIDIPNISHSSIKYNLLMNNFNYTSMGLLDSTHIRFFTLRSIINELSLNRFFIDKIDEFLTQNLDEYEGKKLVSITREDFDLNKIKKPGFRPPPERRPRNVKPPWGHPARQHQKKPCIRR